MFGKISGRIGPHPLRHLKQEKNRYCNICGHPFKPRTAFERFCQGCRADNELLKFSEWLPEAGNALKEHLPA